MLVNLSLLDHDKFIEEAHEQSKLSTCLRKKYGAVVVYPKGNLIIGEGYNSVPKGCDKCSECLRDKYNIPTGQRYEMCRSIHAEVMAILQSITWYRFLELEDLSECVMYMSGDSISEHTEPCLMCKRFIINSGLDTVICKTITGYKIYTNLINLWGNDNSLTSCGIDSYRD